MRNPWLSFAPVAGAVLVASGALAGAQDPWAPPAGFYDGATGTGETLHGQLYDRMRAGHFQRRYGDIRDSALLHDADPDNPGNILLAYDRRSVPGDWDQGATWNREHVWPQSRQPGDASNSSRGNLGDPHALRPATPSVNGARGNKPFGLATTTGDHRSLGTYYFTGDRDKGDVARSLFYSETRYGPELGLELVDGFPGANQMSDLTCLVTWHYADPPDAFERRRNHVIYSSAENPIFFTNNRNAYVDRPEFVWSVYVDQANDARLFVGEAPAADGASTLVVDLGAVFADGPAPPAAELTLRRDGFDGVYFSVEAFDGATVSPSGRHNAFPVNQTGADERTLTVGFDGAARGLGPQTGFVVVDNLDVTTGAGEGRGALDAEDVIMVEVSVVGRADASFEEKADVDARTVDLGVIEARAGDARRSVPVYHLGEGPDVAAALDLEPGDGTGDTARLLLGFDGISGLPAGDEASLAVTLSDDVPGAFSAIYVIETYDDRTIPGARAGEPLVLELVGEVVLPPCPGDLDGDGAVGAQDLAILISSWGETGADMDGDAVTGASDLAILVSGWGSCGS